MLLEYTESSDQHQPAARQPLEWLPKVQAGPHSRLRWNEKQKEKSDWRRNNTRYMGQDCVTCSIVQFKLDKWQIAKIVRRSNVFILQTDATNIPTNNDVEFEGIMPLNRNHFPIDCRHIQHLIRNINLCEIIFMRLSPIFQLKTAEVELYCKWIHRRRSPGQCTRWHCGGGDLDQVSTNLSRDERTV